MRSGICGTRSSPETKVPGSGTAISRLVWLWGWAHRLARISIPDVRPLVRLPELETASRCDDVLSAARPAHPKRNRSGCVIPEHSVDTGELRPSHIIAHPKVGGPTPARPARSSRTAGRVRHHITASTRLCSRALDVRHEDHRMRWGRGDKFGKCEVGNVVNFWE